MELGGVGGSEDTRFLLLRGRGRGEGGGGRF